MTLMPAAAAPSCSTQPGSPAALAACFGAGALAGAGLALAAWRLHCLNVQQQQQQQQQQPVAAATQQPPQQQQHGSLQAFEQDEILAEQLTRNVQFFGLAAQRAIAKAHVVVVGLGVRAGSRAARRQRRASAPARPVLPALTHRRCADSQGVGSHAAHLLLRSGVGRLRLVDFDQVTLSSLNRHALATRADVGTPKATCLARHFAGIMPEAEVEAVVAMCSAKNVEQLLAGQPDFVLDAIDNIHTKVSLLEACKARGIPVLCVAGAGAKADPTRLRFADISESSVDPLARAVRHRLRRERGIHGGIPVLLSTEKPRCQLVSMVDMQGGNPLDYQVVPNFRVRTIPVLGTAPAIFGMAAASYILCQLAGAPFEGEPVIQLTALQYDRALSRLQQREEEVFGNSSELPLDRDDLVFLLREVYRGFSARSERVVPPGGDRGLMRSTAELHFTRWDAAQLPRPDNLVLLTAEEADAHDAAGLQALRAREPQYVAHVERLLDHVRAQLYY